MTEEDLISARLGFAAGNGLNPVSPFQLSTWVADLQDDVKDINGRGRNYLLTAWYQHNFTLDPDVVLQATVGIIDSTDYLDNNVYSNDEYTQFMNEALVNSPHVLLPSYDRGVALTWSSGVLTVHGVYMNVGLEEEDTGIAAPVASSASDDYDYVGVEAGYTISTPLGVGNYRVLYSWTSDDFTNPEGTQSENRSAFLLSFDQSLGESLGGFLRAGGQSDNVAVRYEYLCSGGIDISGRLWGRMSDNVGIGVAYLGGGNQSIEDSRVAETYYRFAFNGHVAVTADLQYMRDVHRDGDNAEGFILGLRAETIFQ